MSKSLLRKLWLQARKLREFLDRFFVYCGEGLEAVTRMVPDIVTFRLQLKSGKKKDYQPRAEPLEDRLVPAGPTVQFSSSTYSLSESGGSATITATLSAPSSDTITVNYETVNNSALAGSDYMITSGTLTFIADETSKTFSVPVLSDSLDEDDESVSLVLTAPSNAELGTPVAATLTIEDDDTMPTVSFTASSQSASEDAGTMTITAQLSAVSGRGVTVPFTLGGSATEGSGADYTITSSPIVIAAGQTSATVTITINDDFADESSEDVVATMGSPTNATAGATTVHTATIQDNDAVWDGGGSDDNMSTAENWVGDVAPAAGDMLIFDGTSSDPAIVDASFAGTIGNLRMLSGYSGTITLDRTLTVTESVVLASGTLVADENLTVNEAMLHSGGTLGGTATVTISDGAAYAWTAGTMTGTGTTLIDAGADLTISTGNGRYLDGGRTLENEGTAVWSDNGTIYGGTGAGTILNEGNFDVQGDVTFHNNSGTLTFSNAAGATLTRSTSSGTATFFSTFDNDGTLAVETGTLLLNGGGTGTANFTVADDATLEFAGGTYSLTDTSSLSGNGAVKVSAGTVEEEGTYNVGATVIAGGTFTLTSNGATVDAELSGGTLGGSGTFTVSDSLVWTAGAMTGAGTTLIDAGADLTISTGNGRYLDGGRTLENEGTAVWSDNGVIYGGTGAGTILNEGNFDVQGDVTFHNNSGTLTFSNAAGATLTRSTSSGTATFFSTFDNDGTLAVETGTLLLNGGGTIGGTATVAADAHLQFQSASFSVADGTVLSGSGTYHVSSSGTIVVDDAASVSNLSLESGTIAGSGILSVTDNLAWTGGTMTGAGTTLIDAGADLTISTGNGRYLDGGRTLENEGTAVWSDNGVIYGGTGAGTILNEGNFDVQGDVTFHNNSGTLTFSNAAGATLTRSTSSGTATFFSTFDNDGTLAVETGTLLLNGGGTIGGTATVAADAHLQFQSASFSVADGTVLSGSGTYHVSSSGTIVVDDAASVSNLSLESGTIAGSGILSVTDNLAWTGGTMTGAGTTLIDAGADLTISTGNGRYLDGGRTLENEGTAVWSDNGVIYGGTGAGTILNEGNFDVQGDVTFHNNSGTLTFSNAAGATLTRSTSSGTATFVATFNNDGTIEVQVGTLSLTTGFNSGLVIIHPDATLTYLGGSYTLESEAVAEFTAHGGYTYQASDEAEDEQTVAEFTDPDGEAAQEDYTATIDWGDGSEPSDGTITYVAESESFIVVGNHRYEEAGSYVVSVTIEHVTRGEVVLNGWAVAPLTAVDDEGLDTDEDTPLTISAESLLANDDVDGDHDLTITNYSQPEHGTVTYNGVEFIYTPFDDHNGSDQFTYSINQGNGYTDSASVFITVNPINDAPVAKSDDAYVDVNSTVVISVLANDSDLEDDDLEVTAVTQGTHGTATITGDGTTVTYEPDADYFGPDTFTYTISDGNGGTTIGSVYVTVGEGQWATSVIDTSSQWTSSGPYDWYAAQALGTPNTLYGDNSTAWAPESADDGEQWIVLGFAEQVPATGLLIRETSGNGFVTKIDLQDSGDAWHTIWTGTDATPSDAVGSFFISFTETAYDVKAVKIFLDTDHAEGTWEEIDAVRLFSSSATPLSNSAPEINEELETVLVDEDDSVNIPIADLATDDEAFFIAFSEDPEHGWIEINDNETPNDLADDFLVYTPDADYNGADSFGFTLTDIYGASASGTVDITVEPTNDDPLGQDAFINAEKNTAKNIDVLDTAEDMDGDDLTIGIDENPAHGTAVVDDNDTAEDPTDDFIVYTPTTNYTGFDQFIYSLDDGNGGEVSYTAYVNVYESGEWATSVEEATSQYAEGDDTDWAADQALGEPDTHYYGDTPTAWAPAEQNDGTQSITLNFETPAQATGVLVRQNSGVGFITQIELFGYDPENNNEPVHEVIWTGTDESPANHLTNFILTFPQRDYLVTQVKIVVDTDHDENAWEEIDAVRLLTGGSPSTTSVSYQVDNDNPTAEDDRTTTELNQPVEIQVLGNDYDPEGDTLTIDSVTQGANGTVSITGDGTTVTYTPDEDWSGDDTFTYTIEDPHGGTTTATVNVRVYPLGQWASRIEDVSSQYITGDSYDYSPLQALGAPDVFAYGDTPAAWTAAEMNNGEQTITFGFAVPDYAVGVIVRESSGNGFVTKIELQDTGDAWHEIWTGTDESAADEVADLTVNFTETAYQVKAVRVTVDTDHDLEAWEQIDAVRLLTVTEASPANTAPTAENYEVETSQGLPIYIYAMADAEDADGDPLRLVIDQHPENGSVEINNAGTPNDTSDDFLIYRPYASGEDSFTYKVVDPRGGSATGTVDVTVSAVNQAPDAASDVAYVDVNSSVTVAVLENDSDAEEDELEITAVTQGQYGTVTITGDGTTVTYEPDEDFTGPDWFTYTIDDGNGNTTVGSVSVIVYPQGQWASAVKGASSNIPDADEALGKADDTYWSSEGATALEFLTVEFATAQAATGVLIRESGGAVMQVQLIDDTGGYHTIWTGTDPTIGPGDFILNFEETAYDVKAVKILLAWGGSIDAVRLLTGGDAEELTLSASGYDNSGSYQTTLYNEDGTVDTILTYHQGQFVQGQDFAYTDDYVSALTVTDALYRQTHYTYDEDGNKLTETFGFGTAGASTTTYTYTDGVLTSLVDPKGNETTWVHDGNTVTMTDPLNKSEIKTYDDAGKLLSILNRNGLLRTFEYDEQDRLETETWYDGPTDEDDVVETFTWTYTATGQVKTATNSAGTYTFQYDASGRVIHVDEPFGVSLTFAYDSNGNRILVLDSLGGKEVSVYDDAGNLVRRILTQGETTLRIDRTYDSFGRVRTQTRYSDAEGTELVATSTYVYDPRGSLVSIIHKDSENEIISQFDYVYDTAGQLMSRTDFQVDIDGEPWVTDYGYDDQGQLTDDGETSYDYDLGGNRDTGHTYTRNFVDTADTNQLASDGTWDYSYDDEGNLTKKVEIVGGLTWVYGYDHANHLVLAQKWSEDPDVEVEAVLLMESQYKYDAFGNRVEKDVDLDGEGEGTVEVQRYALDGWNPAKASRVGNENYDVWADLDGDSSLKTHYLRGNSVDELGGRVDLTDPYWYLSDHLGSTRDIIDNTGTLKDSLVYDAFGNITTETHDEFRGRYTWTSREFDLEIELQFNRARYYDPTTGRWISQDPLGFDAGDSNLYRYVNNRPTYVSDPSGLQQDPFGLPLLKEIEGYGKNFGGDSLKPSKDAKENARNFYRALDFITYPFMLQKRIDASAEKGDAERLRQRKDRVEWAGLQAMAYNIVLLNRESDKDRVARAGVFLEAQLFLKDKSAAADLTSRVSLYQNELIFEFFKKDPKQQLNQLRDIDPASIDWGRVRQAMQWFNNFELLEGKTLPQALELMKQRNNQIIGKVDADKEISVPRGPNSVADHAMWFAFGEIARKNASERLAKKDAPSDAERLKLNHIIGFWEKMRPILLEGTEISYAIVNKGAALDKNTYNDIITATDRRITSQANSTPQEKLSFYRDLFRDMLSKIFPADGPQPYKLVPFR